VDCVKFGLDLASAIRFAQQPNIISNAEKLGQELRKENGVKNAVKIINDYITTGKTESGNIVFMKRGLMWFLPAFVVK